MSIPGHSWSSETKGIVQFAVGHQAGVGGDLGPVGRELEPAVDRDPRGFFVSPVASAIPHPPDRLYVADQNRRGYRRPHGGAGAQGQGP
jgi:hypothetical protein